MDLKSLQVWFIPGSQPLYGEAVLRQVADNSPPDRPRIQHRVGPAVQVVFKPW